MSNLSTHPARRPQFMDLHRLNQHVKKHVLENYFEAWEELLGEEDLRSADHEYEKSGNLYGKSVSLIRDLYHRMVGEALQDSCYSETTHFHQIEECEDFWTFVITTAPIAPKHLWVTAECSIRKTEAATSENAVSHPRSRSYTLRTAYRPQKAFAMSDEEVRRWATRRERFNENPLVACCGVERVTNA